MKTVRTIISILVLNCLLSCSQLKLNNYAIGDWASPTVRDRSVQTIDSANTNSNLAEVASPQIIQELHQELKQYSPQVKIAAPQADKTLNQTDVVIKLTVKDLPIFQDDRLHLGNHLNLIVDNEPFQSIYSLDEPIIIKNLAPGTHTIRVFAVSPWGESFKNEGAYAQTTFNVLTQTNTNRPNSDLPLLTYSSPTGTYGAEPVLLDFYLHQDDSAIGFASPKAIAKNNPDEQKLLVKATINGTSLIIEDWQPYYLTGFEPGENWVQLELIDKFGNTIENTFNNTVRVFTYDPQQQDNLAKLITNKITFDDAQSIVKQSYYLQPSETPEIVDFEDNEEKTEENTKPKITPLKELEPIPQQLPSADSVTTNQDNQSEKLAITIPQTEKSAPRQPSNSQSIVSNEVNRANKVSEVKIEPTDKNGENIDPAFSNKTDSDLLAFSNSQADPKTAATKLESKPTASKIVITESAPKESPPIVEIIIPPSESVEVVEPDKVAFAVPTNQYNGNSSEPKSTSGKFLWWKKILVGVRQTIEALARQLPNEV